MVGSCLGEIVDVLSGENVVGEVGGGGVSILAGEGKGQRYKGPYQVALPYLVLVPGMPWISIDIIISIDIKEVYAGLGYILI